MTMLQKKSRKRMLMCVCIIGVLIFMFVGCEEAPSPTDTTPPAPKGLTAVAGNGEVSLRWTAPTGGAAVAQYYIYRVAGTDIGSATRLTNTTPAMINTTTYTDTSAENGTQYTYAVRAVSANGAESGNSNTVTATPFAIPDTPTTLTAIASNGIVTLTWSAPASGSTVSQYYIYRAMGDSIEGATRLKPTDPVMIDTTTYTDFAVANGTQYTYAVRAVSANNTESGNSNTVTATPLAVPYIPTNLRVTRGNTSAVLNWDAPVGGPPFTQYYIYRVEGTDISSATRVPGTNAAMITDTTYTDSGLTNGTQYTYAVRSVNANNTQSAYSNTASVTPSVTALSAVATIVANAPRVTLTWIAVEGATEYRIYRTVGAGSEAHLTTTPPMLTATTTTYTDSDIAYGIAYRYRIQVISSGGMAVSSNTARTTAPVDSDNDTLIDIQNLDMLDNIRHNLSGTSYKTSSGDTGLQCGMDGTTACTGYELMRDLDFAVAADYASGSINMAWRPTASGSVVAAGSATNSGWQPIGPSLFESLSTIFEGNGRSISNLYVRNTANTNNSRLGLFSYIHARGTLRNLRIADSNIYGGSMSDDIGIAAGVNGGTIANVVVRGGSVDGGNAFDNIGALVGSLRSGGSVVASSASATVNGGDNGTSGGDQAGGLVGYLDGGSIFASYASGVVDGGLGNNDVVGGLFGQLSNSGAVYASYATGNVSGGMGDSDIVGGLFGQTFDGTTIIANYATGAVMGGAGNFDIVGRFGGKNANFGSGIATLTANYGFGTTSDAGSGGSVGYNGATLPAGATTAAQLTVPVAMNPPTTAVAAEWNQAASNSLNAWNFGSNTQAPVLRYADYDGAGGTDYCALFSVVPGTRADITCGTTLLPHQR